MSTFNNSNNFRARKFTACLLAALAFPHFAAAQGEKAAAPNGANAPADPAVVAMRQVLQQRYPNTRFGEIARTPLPGVWEVWMGANVAYVTDEGRHFIFGHLYDMQTQTDLTASKQDAINARLAAQRPQVKFSDLPLEDAIKVVRGNGERKIAVFSDPDCPYCRKLESQLGKLDNVTIYTFLYPIEALHPEATTVSESIWCAKDRATAWKKYMSTGRLEAKTTRCDSPIARNIELAGRAGIQGTPFLFFANGEKAAGALDLASLERHIAGK
jgi:thiol:disulfide interchange protein DsbC